MACSGCGHRFRVVRGRQVTLSLSVQPAIPGERGERGDRGARASMDKASRSAIVAGAAMALSIAFLFGALDGGAGAALVAASLGGIVCGLFLKRRRTPEVPVQYISPDRQASYATTARLRTAKGALLASRNERATTLRERQHLRHRLVGLRTRMEELALPAYGPRIANIDAALVMLERQIAMDLRLRNSYDRNIKMIEIELDAGVAADQMNEDVSAAIGSALGELRELERCQAELERQLEANVEVEQLLRPAARVVRA